MPDPDGPTMATSSPWSIRRLTPARATTGGSPGYSFTTSASSRTGAGAGVGPGRDRDRLGHGDGTSTRVPAVMPDPLTWTRVSLYRPVVTPARWLVLPVTTSTPYPPPGQGQQRVHRHGQDVARRLGGDVDVHRGLVVGGAGRGAVQGDGDRHRRRRRRCRTRWTRTATGPPNRCRRLRRRCRPRPGRWPRCRSSRCDRPPSRCRRAARPSPRRRA